MSKRTCINCEHYPALGWGGNCECCGEFGPLWVRANEAGVKAGEATVPIPMVIGKARGLIGDEMVEGPRYVIPEGPCGFAWVNVRPGTSRFARWLKEMDYARTDSYLGGVTIWIGEHDQSVTRKEAHAAAMAEVLKEGGIKAHADSRLG